MQKLIKKRRKGFTLIELIVVMAVIAILVLLATPRFLKYTIEAKEAKVMYDAKVVENKIEEYLIHNDNKLPDSLPIVPEGDIQDAIDDGRVYDYTGPVAEIPEGPYCEVDDILKDINNKTDGTIISNNNGDTYIILDKPIRDDVCVLKSNQKITEEAWQLINATYTNAEVKAKYPGAEFYQFGDFVAITKDNKILDANKNGYTIVDYLRSGTDIVIPGQLIISKDGFIESTGKVIAVDEDAIYAKGVLKIEMPCTLDVGIDDENLPIGPTYHLATDADFTWVDVWHGYSAINQAKVGYYNYTGTEKYVIIPDTINGWSVTNGLRMFSDSSVEGVQLHHNKITDMGMMFWLNKSTNLDLSKFNTSNVTNMTRMFYGISAEEIIGLSNFNTSNVTDMSYMFAQSMATNLDLSNFNTSKVTDMFEMFGGSMATNLDLSNFNTSNVTNMNGMFQISQFLSLDLSKFDTSKVTDMGRMFQSTKMTSLDLSNFNTSNVTNMNAMFNNSKAMSLDLSNFNTSKVTNMGNMFFNAEATSLKLTNFDTSNVIRMDEMFRGSKITSLDLSSFNTSKVTNLDRMFQDSQVTILDLSSFDTSKVIDRSDIFRNSPATTGYAKTQADADKLNASSSKPATLIFTIR